MIESSFSSVAPGISPWPSTYPPAATQVTVTPAPASSVKISPGRSVSRTVPFSAMAAI